MGSFIITLKTINRAGIYTRSRDPALEQGSNPLHSPAPGHPGEQPPASPPEHSHPCGSSYSKGLLRMQGPFKPATSMTFYHWHLVTARISM